VWKQYCSKGANIRAVFYLASFLDWIFRHEPEFAPWVKDGKPDDVVFRALAEIPMEWMQPGQIRQGPPFDGEDFMQRLRSE
jgi:hypothetical protein